MHVGEVTGLRWCDVDLEEGDVNHTCYFNINTTKTPTNNRQVSMLDFVKDAFLMEKEKQELLDLHWMETGEFRLIKWIIFDILKLAKGGVDMNTAIATATEMQNNFGRYLNLVMSGQEIIVTKNGREVGRFIPKDAAVSYLTDSLTGILKGNYDLDEAKAERLKEKYEAID